MPQFSRHARDRMAERHITEQDVVDALANQLPPPLPGNQPTTLVVLGAVRGGILKLVVEAADQSRIVSAMWRKAPTS
jgi:hypothetical protein